MPTLEDKTAHWTLAGKRNESHFWNVSVRGWLAILIILTACVCVAAVVLASVSVSIYKGSLEPLGDHNVVTMWTGIKDLSYIVLGYYCGKEAAEHLRRPPRGTNGAEKPEDEKPTNQ